MSATSDARSLFRAELSSRRIDHPHASYAGTKSNALSCNVCGLAIKSEALWEGHLRSANHRRNAAASKARVVAPSSTQNGGSSENRKRKLHELNDDEAGTRQIATGGESGQESIQLTMTENGGRKRKAQDELETNNINSTDSTARDERKKSKNQPSFSTTKQNSTTDGSPIPGDQSTTRQETDYNSPESTSAQSLHPTTTIAPSPPSRTAATAETIPDEPSSVNEDEWAAFEREVIPLSHQYQPPPPTSLSSLTATNAAVTISALPTTTSNSKNNTSTNGNASSENATKTKHKEAEAAAEMDRLDEAQKLQGELDIQEEMDRKLKRLKEQREGLKEVAAARRAGKGEQEEEGGMSVQANRSVRVEGNNTIPRDSHDTNDIKSAFHHDALNSLDENEHTQATNDKDEEDSDNDDDEEADDLDEWGFG